MFALFLVGVFVVLVLKISLLATDYDLEETLGDEEDNLDGEDDIFNSLFYNYSRIGSLYGITVRSDAFDNDSCISSSIIFLPSDC